jgi:hypothetical protein
LAAIGATDRAEDDRWPELAGRGQVLRLQDLLHQRLLVVRVVDDEPRADPDRLAIPAQDPRADRMERAGHDVAAGLPHETDDPLPQLARGAIREGDGEDLPWPDALHADQVRHAMREDPGLAAAGAREDEQRPLGGGDGLRLFRVEAGEDARRQDFGRAPDLGVVRGGAGRGAVSGRGAKAAASARRGRFEVELRCRNVGQVVRLHGHRFGGIRPQLRELRGVVRGGRWQLSPASTGLWAHPSIVGGATHLELHRACG